ncbi:LysM peptidoglycan-binding domain-containing protein [Citreimonas sp.]|uniref:LysM peptidoglycan-binding domain-containing protein n=1 Tax=Citreimonas sp. TaxID=3036715 RepID=UPI0040589421
MSRAALFGGLAAGAAAVAVAAVVGGAWLAPQRDARADDPADAEPTVARVATPPAGERTDDPAAEQASTAAPVQPVSDARPGGSVTAPAPEQAVATPGEAVADASHGDTATASSSPAPAVADSEPAAPAPVATTSGAPALPGDTDPVALARVAAPEAPGIAEDGGAVPQTGVAMPAFDLVRAETDGSALVAGSAEPGARIDVLLNGSVAASADAGRDGRFAVFLDMPADGGAQVFALRQTAGDMVIDSRDEVIVAPRMPVASETPDAEVETDLARVQSKDEKAVETEGSPDSETAAQDATVVATAQPPATPASPDLPQDRVAATQAAATAADPQRVAVPDSTEPAPELPAATATALVAAAPETAEGAPTVAEDTASGAAPAQTPEDQAASSRAAPAAEETKTAGAATATAESPVAASTPPQTPILPVQTAQPQAPDASGAPVALAAAPVSAPDPADPARPMVLRSTPQGVEVMPDAPLAPGQVALDQITYDDSGAVQVAGRGHGGGFVRLYLDNAPIATAQIAADGRWRTTLPQVDTGTYTLRVDRIEPDGTVAARAESPFRRVDPDLLSQARADGAAISVTVQPGNTLWGISRIRYGEGIDYVRIFDANRDQIRDPDLIYPGQIFDLPE